VRARVQVLNTQRDRIYAERRKALLALSLEDVMLEYSTETMNDILEARTATAPQRARGDARSRACATLCLNSRQPTNACMCDVAVRRHEAS
jgi:preprotein translocase subunit SecA